MPERHRVDTIEANILQGILRAVGVSGGAAVAGVVETGDLIELWRKLTESLGFG